MRREPVVLLKEIILSSCKAQKLQRAETRIHTFKK